nr:MAG TPA: hypothetical protein [Caudoviricetes sp.]
MRFWKLILLFEKIKKPIVIGFFENILIYFYEKNRK